MKKIKERLNHLTDKQRKILYYLVVGIIIVGLIAGLSFAWFSATVSGNEEAKEDVVETANLSIIYTNKNEIKGENIIPGWSEEKTFTVENTGDATAYYNINWENLTNEFSNKKDLTITLTSTNGGGSVTKREINSSGTHKRIITYISIEAGVIQTYTLKVEYSDSGSNQNIDQGKKLLGKIEVEEFSPNTASDKIISKAPTIVGSINSEGLTKIEQQNPSATEYRYSGSNDEVKNYVTFNEEAWRIIGVFSVDDGTGNYEQRLKIIRDTSLGSYSWDSSENSINGGSGINEWSQADLKTELNGVYYNRQSGTCYNVSNNASVACDFTSTGLNESARNMIENAKWYTSSYNPEGIISSQAYTYERANSTNQCGSFSSYDCNGESVTRTTSWTGKIALAYPSDYGYASSSCYSSVPLSSSDKQDYRLDTCKNSNWMFNKAYQWFLSPISDNARRAQNIISAGSVSSNSTYNPLTVKPVTYLKSSVKIISGSGSSSDPYTLSL